MNVFGMQWDRHFETIEAHWRERVRDEDIVLIPGDISWAMQMKDVTDDLESIAALPGQKVLLRGNHDFWWSSISKVREALGPGMHALQNDAIALGDVVFFGTRGWMLHTQAAPLEEQDQKIFIRELGRLQMSLNHARKIAEGRPLIALMHFPPLFSDGAQTPFSSLFQEAGVTDVVYGHLHGAGIRNGFTGECGGVRYHIASCDAIGFCPKLISQ